MNMPSKRCCKVCEITKDIDNFNSNRNKNNIESKRHTCIDCEKEKIKERYLKNREKILDYQRNKYILKKMTIR